MSYRIEYRKKSDKIRNRLYICLGVLCLLLCYCLQYLAITRTGPILEALAQDLQQGVPVRQAVETFCEDFLR